MCEWTESNLEPESSPKAYIVIETFFFSLKQNKQITLFSVKYLYTVMKY